MKETGEHATPHPLSPPPQARPPLCLNESPPSVFVESILLDEPWGLQLAPQEGLLQAGTCLLREEPEEVPGAGCLGGSPAAVIAGHQSPGWALSWRHL